MISLLINKVVTGFQLNPILEKLLSDGFTCHKGCYFLKSLYKLQNHINQSDFIDSTGYECFINSIHFDDYVNENIIEQALLFSDHLIRVWNTENNGLILRLILSETDFGFNLKFHLFREQEKWINENDIDKFKEALVIFNSCC